jgi:vacuolar-type H+-ATPase subunit E/Vma4
MSEITLIEKIKNDAAKTVEEIKSTAATEVESIQREVQAEITELDKTYAIALEKAKDQQELVAVSRANQAGNIAIQRAKRNQINAIFSAVVRDIESKSTSEYIDFFIKHAREILPEEVEIDYVQASSERGDETKEILQKLGSSGEIKTDSTIKAGLVIYAKDGVYDITLTRLMNERRNELEMVIVNKVMS